MHGGGRETHIGAWRRQQHVQNAVFGGIGSAAALADHGSFPGLLHGHFHQITDDGVHILADIAHFGELGGLYLDEGCIGQLGQAAGNLRFAHTCGANHEDIFRRDFGTQRARHLLPAPAVAQRNGDRTLGCGLANDVPIQLGHDILGGQLTHGFSTSTVWCMLV